MDIEKFERVSKVLNEIRREADRNDGKVDIGRNTKKWDAIFFAEIFLEKLAYEAKFLGNITSNI